MLVSWISALGKAGEPTFIEVMTETMHEGDNDWDQPVWIYYGRLGMAKLIAFSDEMTDTVDVKWMLTCP